MASSTYSQFAKRTKPQTEPLNPRQSQNNAGGFVFTLDSWRAMERFLILGSEGGTYYVGEQKLTADAAKHTLACITEDGPKAVQLIVAISDSGRAAKNDPALFALALAASAEDRKTRSLALAVLPKVARIPTHLFHFVDYVTGMRGWGRSLRTAVANWYNGRDANPLAYIVTKYQSRDGWSNKDLAILSHPQRKSVAHGAVFDWILRGKEALSEDTPKVILAYHEAQHASPKRIAALIREHNLSREMLPTQALNHPIVWDALLEKMPLTALIRNLGNIAKHGLTDPFSSWTNDIVQQLTTQAALTKARVHPLTILNGMKTYATGQGFRGASTWKVNQKIVSALDTAFYLAFKNVTPTNKNLLLALDVSGSMFSAPIANSQLTAGEAAAAMALVTANVEPNHHIVGFTANGKPGSRGYMGSNRYGNLTSAITDLEIGPKMRLADVVTYMQGIGFGGTDCALPMQLATAERYDVDAFCIYTDNETWAGSIHPMDALRTYRNTQNKPAAKLIVTGMTATTFTIADPLDPNCLDVVGFDTATPATISEFIR